MSNPNRIFLEVCPNNPDTCMGQGMACKVSTTAHTEHKGNAISGGSKGDARDVHPPGSPNSFNFMQILGNFGKFICWHPPG